MNDEKAVPIHTHQCMRCLEEFECRTPGGCQAGKMAIPNIITRSDSGEVIITPHCPESPDWHWIRAYAERRIAALQAEVDALKATNATYVHDLGHLQNVNCKLQAKVARLSAPVTAEEMRDHSVKVYNEEGQHGWMFDRQMVNALILARATPPQDVENGGKQ